MKWIGSRLLRSLLLMVSVAALCRCRQATAQSQNAQGSSSSTPSGPPTTGRDTDTELLPDPPPSLVGDRLDSTTFIGPSQMLGRLQVFSILSNRQYDVGPLTTLDAALAARTAEVRELGADSGSNADTDVAHAERPASRSVNRGRRSTAQGWNVPEVSESRSALESGPSVGTLVIDNRGDVPIYVLAGTVVKGGRQDRQIGQDFIVSAHSKAPIDAFCVEHGRWSAERDGRSTGGRFGTIRQLATSSVRAAGQYKQDQHQVWAKVGEVNSANRKSAASGTLLATLDDHEVTAKREALATSVRQFLDQKHLQPWMVGYGYAIDGRVQGVRWFAHRKVFAMFEDVLVNTIAVDTVTAVADGRVVQAQPLPASAVTSFVSSVEAAKDRKVRETAAENTNEYAESASAYGSKTVTKASAKPARVISSDYLKK